MLRKDEFGRILTIFEAYQKINNTCCLNSADLKFNIDTEDLEDCTSMYEMIVCLDVLEKATKAITLVKEKQINLMFLEEYGLETYNNEYKEEFNLTQEEYDIIMEVFYDEKAEK